MMENMLYPILLRLLLLFVCIFFTLSKIKRRNRCYSKLRARKGTVH
jgi:hypothetical protein